MMMVFYDHFYAHGRLTGLDHRGILIRKTNNNKVKKSRTLAKVGWLYTHTLYELILLEHVLIVVCCVHAWRKKTLKIRDTTNSLYCFCGYRVTAELINTGQEEGSSSIAQCHY